MQKPIRILLIALLITSCNRPEVKVDQFSGTLPAIGPTGGSTATRNKPKAIFINLLENAVEIEGERFPAEIISEDDSKVEFRTSFPLDQEVMVTGMTYMKQDQVLDLELGDMGKSIRLERNDRMISDRVRSYARVDLKADISRLTGDQKKMLGLLLQVSDIMNDIYWLQVFPDRDAALSTMINQDAITYFRINYGPWDRLNGNLPYMSGYGSKPPGSGFYPSDMTIQEFDLLDDPEKNSLYTLITRDQEGRLKVIPYHEAFAPQVERAAELLKEASRLAKNKEFGNYLALRADALLTDDYLASDIAWMEMKDNDIDFIAGPIETYEDGLFSYKAAHEAFLLLKDQEWSKKLQTINSILPALQNGLPVAPAYRREMPGLGSDLAVYDAIYYAGDCNAGSKTIAINLPNDPRVRSRKGTRRLQLKNAIWYKFEEILVPISNVLIAEDQREHVTFDAFFENTMFHEVAHGLGIKNTINGSGTVRSALLEQYSVMEEGKADVLSLYLITLMQEKGMVEPKDLMDNYVTFLASIFRSVRFGASNAHGMANMIRFYYFLERGAFSREPGNGTYRIDLERMKSAVRELAGLILSIQGDGDYNRARQLSDEMGHIQEGLQSDLDRLRELSIPVDIVFNQGAGVLGL